MLFPVGKVLHQNLSTSFTNFEELTSGLKSDRFTGYIQLHSWDYEGYIFIDTGKISQGIEFHHGVENVGPQVIEHFHTKTDGSDGNISVHQLSQETLFVLISLGEKDVIRKDSSTTDESMSELLDELQGDEFTGIIDIQFGKDFGKSTIYLHDGIPVDCVITSKSGKTLSGIAIYEKVVDLSMKVEAKYNVVKGDLIKALEALDISE